MYDLLAFTDLSVLAESQVLKAWAMVWPYLAMLAGFSLIVFIHELGHFAVAKWAGVRVERFAVGFGRELFGFTRGETRYSFNLLPLGGYVKMLGQEDFDDKSNELRFKEDPRSFVNKPVGHRMAIVSAGVIMNIILACVLFMIVFMIGMEATPPRIAFIEPDSPANKAGLLPGDIIRQVNGEKVIEFNEVRFAVLLAPPHEPIEFVIERNGQVQPPIYIKPTYNNPESTRDMQRLIIGIAPGVTGEIVAVGPEIDAKDPHQPRVGDRIVEVDGGAVTDANASEIFSTLVYAKGDIYVERPNTDDPKTAPQRVRVEIAPLLSLYPSNPTDPGTVNVLGLTPLARFGMVDPRGRAYLAGISVSDTVLSWNDKPHPNIAGIANAIRDNAETDIPFKVQKPDGRVVGGFVRPKRNARGLATIQAQFAAIESASPGEPQTQFTEVRHNGAAAQAGIERGDLILRCDDVENPTRRGVSAAILNKLDKPVPLTVRKPDGRIVKTAVVPQAPGSIDATYTLVADDVLRTGDIVATLNGRPSPAAESGIPPGVRIVAIDDKPVSKWRELIAAFHAAAGSTVRLSFVEKGNDARSVPFRVPQSLRTLLGVGPEARIVSIDGRDTVGIETSSGGDNLAVGYHEGTRTILAQLVGKEHVPVEYRENPLASIKTAYVDVSADMVDPWVSRIAFSPSIAVNEATTVLKGENAGEAIWIGMHKTYYFVFQVYKTIERMFFTKSVGLENMSGPLGIIDMGGKIAQAGLVKFLFFLAIISANLAVINFLPLPIVDGGLMVFLIIEKIKGSPVSLRVQVATQVIGLFLIIGAFVFVTYQDALRLWG
ncbi:MAG: RIP metalloprotease RseP [Planctomycetota bacterium]